MSGDLLQHLERLREAATWDAEDHDRDSDPEAWDEFASRAFDAMPALIAIARAARALDPTPDGEFEGWQIRALYDALATLEALEEHV